MVLVRNQSVFCFSVSNLANQRLRILPTIWKGVWQMAQIDLFMMRWIVMNIRCYVSKQNISVPGCFYYGFVSFLMQHAAINFIMVRPYLTFYTRMNDLLNCFFIMYLVLKCNFKMDTSRYLNKQHVFSLMTWV